MCGYEIWRTKGVFPETLQSGIFGARYDEWSRSVKMVQQISALTWMWDGGRPYLYSLDKGSENDQTQVMYSVFNCTVGLTWIVD